MHRIAAILIFIGFYILPAQAQPQTPDVDALFREAQQLAFGNHYKDAREAAREVLEIAPKYHDARVLIGRTYAWEQKFDSARFELRQVFKYDTAYLDALNAITEVEFWAKQYPEALTWCEKALKLDPGNRELLLKKAKILMAMGREAEARDILAQLLNANPNSFEVNALLASLDKYRNRVIVEHTFDFFRDPYIRRWHMSSLQYQRDTKWGTVIGKANVAQIVEDKLYLTDPDFQLEVDAYPIIRPGTYIYLNYGYAWGELFPRHRVGIEPFQSLGDGWEASLGGRYLNYDSYISSLNHVFIFTGSLGKYFDNNWASFRPYLVIAHNNFSQSYYFFYRHYLDIPENYIGGALGFGSSPDENFTKTADFSKNSLNSYRMRVDAQHKFGKRFIARLLVGLTYEKYAFEEYRYRFDSNLYVAYLF